MLLTASTYLLICIAIGVMQVLDAAWVHRRPQQALGSPLLLLFSFFEYAWAAVSYFMLTRNDGSLPAWIPALYLAFVATAFVAGLWHMWQEKQDWQAQQEEGESPAADGAEFAPQVPADFLLAGAAFGACFAAASAYALLGLGAGV